MERRSTLPRTGPRDTKANAASDGSCAACHLDLLFDDSVDLAVTNLKSGMGLIEFSLSPMSSSGTVSSITRAEGAPNILPKSPPLSVNHCIALETDASVSSPPNAGRALATRELTVRFELTSLHDERAEWTTGYICVPYGLRSREKSSGGTLPLGIPFLGVRLEVLSQWQALRASNVASRMPTASLASNPQACPAGSRCASGSPSMTREHGEQISQARLVMANGTENT
mmetsp:Transcript_45390/g.98480  ORF Transcript_45390/g.98480 Transcript_45390/m.98480 type:complete len:228 (-) Transcript_45390:7-690(-)